MRCRDGVLTGQLVFSAAMTTSDSAKRMAQHFSQLLAGIAANPQHRLSSIPLMSPEEQELTIEKFNATNAPVRQITVHGTFESRAAVQPAACCLVGDGGSLPYGQVGCGNVN